MVQTERGYGFWEFKVRRNKNKGESHIHGREGVSCANVDAETHMKLMSPNVSTNLFLKYIRETEAEVNSVDSMSGGFVGSGESRNPFLVSMKLITGETELATGGDVACPRTALLSGA